MSKRRIFLTLIGVTGLLIEPVTSMLQVHAATIPFYFLDGTRSSSPERISPEGIVPEFRSAPLSALAQINAEQVTVKVYAGETWGSGVIIGYTDQTYRVLTNHHVIQRGTTFRIQTSDGQIYEATVDSSIDFGENDLALLQFKSPERVYQVAALGRSQSLQVGEDVFAAGFPIEANTEAQNGYKFTQGKISLISPKVLDGGYQLGYTNDIEKGMSGGPVLNIRGELVAINGVHANPLWGDPYVFADGSHPCEPLRQIMVESSLAIPEATFTTLIDGLNLANSVIEPPSSSIPVWVDVMSAWQTLHLQHRAEASLRCNLP